MPSLTILDLGHNLLSTLQAVKLVGPHLKLAQLNLLGNPALEAYGDAIKAFCLSSLPALKIYNTKPLQLKGHSKLKAILTRYEGPPGGPLSEGLDSSENALGGQPPKRNREDAGPKRKVKAVEEVQTGEEGAERKRHKYESAKASQKKAARERPSHSKGREADREGEENTKRRHRTETGKHQHEIETHTRAEVPKQRSLHAQRQTAPAAASAAAEGNERKGKKQHQHEHPETENGSHNQNSKENRRKQQAEAQQMQLEALAPGLPKKKGSKTKKDHEQQQQQHNYASSSNTGAESSYSIFQQHEHQRHSPDGQGDANVASIPSFFARTDFVDKMQMLASKRGGSFWVAGAPGDAKAGESVWD
ncbi:uncharacterized protein LOC34619209 [Cyclospora cayetanensis]|nr:uncharacterized protein LOC34619209 [Cyclospora cayetanensis]